MQEEKEGYKKTSFPVVPWSRRSSQSLIRAAPELKQIFNKGKGKNAAPVIQPMHQVEEMKESSQRTTFEPLAAIFLMDIQLPAYDAVSFHLFFQEAGQTAKCDFIVRVRIFHWISKNKCINKYMNKNDI